MKVYTIQTKDNLMESIYKNRPDFVINLLPLTLKTNHLFDAKLFKCMKPDSYFINLGRGKTVVEDDLVQILKDKVIAGAGLDVFDVEPLPKESELWNLDNVLMTPHIANIDKNYWKNQIELFINNVQRFKSNKKLKNLMNLERGY
jgi:phosphoglycerate dehydrogenase-like enzyme